MSLNNIYFILVRPQMGENVGSVARAIKNFNFQKLYLIEPKPMEPTKHQYDFDVAAVVAFIKNYGLENDFKLNIENNHATLAGHTYAHEVQVAIDYGLFGSLDINQGDPMNGWDTDEFLHNLYDATELMLVLLNSNGVGNGGMNFDAKTRRSSTDLEDIFISVNLVVSIECALGHI